MISKEALFVGIGLMLLFGAILLAIYLRKTLKKSPTIHLVQGKLTNVNECPLDVNYLKVTNKWEED